ncbi:MAG: protein kinase, partial [Pseudomonas sp.]
RSLADWAAARGPLDAASLLALLGQLIAAVRALQRRGMQGLWLSPRQILLGADGRLLLLPEQAARLPGVERQPLPADAVPLAPELRTGQPVDGRADQFAMAALAYWLLAGQWPEVARPDAAPNSRYRPLALAHARLPRGWDGVLARALAPLPEGRFEALSEFQQALEQPLQQAPGRHCERFWALRWQLVALGVLGLQLAVGLWLMLIG